MFRMNKKCLFCLSLDNRNDNNEFNIEPNCLASKKICTDRHKITQEKQYTSAMHCVLYVIFLIPLSHSECTKDK